MQRKIGISVIDDISYVTVDEENKIVSEGSVDMGTGYGPASGNEAPFGGGKYESKYKNFLLLQTDKIKDNIEYKIVCRILDENRNGKGFLPWENKPYYWDKQSIDDFNEFCKQNNIVDVLHKPKEKK